MEKTTISKGMVTLPVDILILHIFPRLPVKSLIRFKCVSKLWLDLISSSEIADLHFKHSTTMKNNKLVYMSHNTCLIGSCNPKLTPVNFTIPEIKYRAYVIGCCNGLLCLKLGYISHFVCLMLINPFTRRFKEIPWNNVVSKKSYLLAGFGYDGVSEDYKLVLVLRGAPKTAKSDVLVYSMKSDTWKRIEINVDTSSMKVNRWSSSAVLINGHLLHWVFKDYCGGGSHRVYQLGCFDLSTEQWTQVTVPICEYKDFEVRLHILDECLCLLIERWNSSTAVEVWIMKEYGVEESWILVCEYCTNLTPWGGAVTPISFCSPEVLLTQTNHYEMFYLYNIRDKSSTRVDWVNWLENAPFCQSPASFCKESLVAIPGSSQITSLTRNS